MRSAYALLGVGLYQLIGMCREYEWRMSLLELVWKRNWKPCVEIQVDHLPVPLLFHCFLLRLRLLLRLILYLGTLLDPFPFVTPVPEEA